MSDQPSQIEVFQRLNQEGFFRGGTIVEHRTDALVHGRVAYSGNSGYGAVGIGWSHGACNRTTGFSHESWHAEQIGNVVFLRRIAEDSGVSDIPFREVDLYTIILPPR